MRLLLVERMNSSADTVLHTEEYMTDEEKIAIQLWSDIVHNYDVWSKFTGKKKQQYDNIVAQSKAHLNQLALNGSSVCFAPIALKMIPALHQIRWRHYANRNRILILAPRDHGKSFTFAQWLPLESIARNPNIRILLVRKTLDNAEKTLGNIKLILEENQDFRSVFGDLTGPRWTQRQIYCKRTANLIDPTIEAVGCGGSVTGNRADLIICDDIVDPETSQTDGQRKKIREWFHGTLLELLEPHGRVVVIGTRKHFHDLYGHLIEEDPTFEYIHDKAIDCVDPGAIPHRLEFQTRGVKQIATGVELLSNDVPDVLWPEKWNIKKLLLKRASMGSVLFSREQQNEVIDDATGMFKLAHLEACRREDLSYIEDGMNGIPPHELLHGRFNIIVQSWDLSAVQSKELAQQRDTDYTVGVTLGIDGHGNRYLLNLVRERGLGYTQMQDLIKRQYELYLPYCVIIENNLFQNVFVERLIEETALPIVPHTTDHRKHDYYEGVPSLAILFENGKYYLPYRRPDDKIKTNDVIAEFHGLSVERHDDIVMAMYFVEAAMARLDDAVISSHDEDSGALSF